MKYQIIGSMREIKTTKKGARYIKLSLIPTLKESEWTGLHAEQITLWENALLNTSLETEGGEWYASNNKKYYIDVDYDRNGYIVSARVYND